MTNTPAQDALFPGLPPERDVVARFTVPGEPVSKARARFTKRGSKVVAYTPEKTKVGEMRMAAAFRAAGGKKDSSKESTFGVSATFHHGTHQRRDVDNMLKLVLDGLNDVAWLDDTQVVEVAGRKRYAGSRNLAHTEVVVYRVGVIHRRTTPCGWCGKEIKTYESWVTRRFCDATCREASKKARRDEARRERGARAITCEACGTTYHSTAKTPRRFCSNACANAGGRVEIPCAVCSTPFTQYKSWAETGRVYCSPDCAKVHNAEVARRRRTGKFYGTCAICGAGTTRKEYQRCNPCKLAGKTSLPRNLEEV